MKKYTILFLLTSLLAGQAFSQESETTVTPYGFVLFNTAYNANAPGPVDIPVKATGGEEGSFLMTARQSRFGIKFSHTGKLKISGTVELDLWGLVGSAGPGGVGQSAPRMRLAYFKVQFNDNSSLLFGQYWTVTAPLHPSSLAHVSIPEFSSSGNLWNRLPQIRYSYAAESFGVQLALTRPFLGQAVPTLGKQSDYLTEGEYSKMPAFEGRAEYKFGKSAIGVSTHFGSLDTRVDSLGTTTSYAFAGDLKLNFGSLTISGEGFLSQNNKVFFGLGGASYATGEIVDATSTGGWGQITYAAGKHKFNAGFGVESVEDGISNQTIFANVMHTVPETTLDFAFEVGYITTTTPGTPDDVTFNSLTVNFATRYRFGK